MHIFLHIYIYFTHKNNTKTLISLEIILKWLCVCTRNIFFQSVVGHEEQIAPSRVRQLVVKLVINCTMFETFVYRYVARLIMSKSEWAETQVF